MKYKQLSQSEVRRLQTERKEMLKDLGHMVVENRKAEQEIREAIIKIEYRLHSTGNLVN